VAEAFTWTGAYFGVDGGLGSNLADTAWTKDSVDTSKNGSTSLASVVAALGVHAGYNYEFGSAVVGIEADVSGLPSIKKSNGMGMTKNATVSSNTSVLASIRGRLGFVFDHTLVYGTAGIGYQDTKISLGTKDGTVTGKMPTAVAVVGAGIEQKISQHWTAGVEALTYLGGTRHLISSTNTDYKYKSNPTVFRARLNYNF
jgi:outer membrane immunogenic protein